MTTAQMRLYNEIKENPGIRFGVMSRKSKIARKLQDQGLVRWDDEKNGWRVQTSDERLFWEVRRAVDD